MLVAERDHRRLHVRRRRRRRTTSRIRARSWFDVELAGVDEQVGPLAHRLEQLALVGDGLLDAPGGQRVAAPGALEAPDQHVVGRVEEEHPHPVRVARSSSSTSGRSSKYSGPCRCRPGR